MGRANLLNTRTTNFLELLSNGRIYRVPPYQRDYSWGEEQWEDLWNDLADLRREPDERHYMGALVVEGKSDREFLIIDGQQRLPVMPGGPLTPVSLGSGGDTGPTPTPALAPKRFHGTVMVDPTRVGRDAGRIAEEVVAHLVGLTGAEVNVTLEIGAIIPGGAPEQIVRTVTENSRTLKFTSHGFETE